MALDHNGFDLRHTTLFLDCVEQTIKFSKKVVTGRPELPAVDSVPSGGGQGTGKALNTRLAVSQKLCSICDKPLNYKSGDREARTPCR